MVRCFSCGAELTPMNSMNSPYNLCYKCWYRELQNYQPPVQPNIAPSYVNPQFGQGAQQLPVAQHVAPSNVQQATQLYTQQQQFINQFGQQAENIRTSESQAIKDRVG
uniref:Uncharacterized protein n=1 Tax=Meloidogyne javanica TaxID=6303 RepID=A0A915MH10_MELJA